MHLANYLKVNMYDLARFMRHRTPLSTAKYYNPTEEELVALKEQFQESSEFFPDDLAFTLLGDNNV